MAVAIAAAITNNWPRTEALLTADTKMDYAAAKTAAIEWATREAYGDATAPDESEMAEAVKQWIADKATIRLIRVAADSLSLDRKRSQSNRQGQNLTEYDLLRRLDELRDELVADGERAWPLVEKLIGRGGAEDETPAVSVEGLVVDSLSRAQARGSI